MTANEWRLLVGAWVEKQRGHHSVRSMAKKAGISEGLWRQVESGERPLRHGRSETVNPKPSTRAAVSMALGYRDDAISRLLAGKKPVALSRRAAPEVPEDLEESVAVLKQEVTRLQEMSVPGVRLLVRLAERAGVEVPPELRRVV